MPFQFSASLLYAFASFSWQMKWMQQKSLSAGIVPVIFRNSEPHFLLLRVYNYWDFPKGGVEKNEEPFAAALRELQEETTIAHISFPWGNDFIETKPYSAGKVARYYVGEVTSELVILGINPHLGRAEHQESRWVSFEKGFLLLVPRVQEVLKWAYFQVT